jgi:hypothetical protein
MIRRCWCRSRAASRRGRSTTGSPDPAEERQVHSLGATLSLDIAASVAQGPPQCPSQAQPPRHGQHDHGVGASEADVEGTAVVAVHDPALTCAKVGLESPPLLGRRLHPPWLPEIAVQMDDGDPNQRTEPLGTSRLAGASGSDNGNSSHAQPCTPNEGLQHRRPSHRRAPAP